MNFRLYEPTILDAIDVMQFRQSIFDTKFQFKGSNDLDKFDNYIDWLAHALNASQLTSGCFRHSTFLAKLNGEIMGIVEIFYKNVKKPTAHIIECINPLHAREGFGEQILKLATYECNSYGLKQTAITHEISKRIIPKNAENKLLKDIKNSCTF